MSTEPIKCTARTASGKPCKAWAIRGSDPPLCAPHTGLAGACRYRHHTRQQASQHGDLVGLLGLDTTGKVTLAEVG